MVSLPEAPVSAEGPAVSWPVEGFSGVVAGAVGCAAGPAVTRKARLRIEDGAKSSLESVGANAITTELVVRHALQGDVLAKNVLCETASYLGMGIANVISIARTTYLMPAFEVLGPLQISLGRMIGDITRFLVLFTLVS